MNPNDLIASHESLNPSTKETTKLIIDINNTPKKYLINDSFANYEKNVSSTQSLNRRPSGVQNKCPTCNGMGKVSRDEQHKLVALIPLDDNRLKPRRIWLWILSTFIICSFVAIALTFLFVPRTIYITNDLVNVEPYNVTFITGLNSTKIFGIEIYFNEQYKIQNDNFYQVKMNNLTLELTRISHITTPDLYYDKDVPISPRSSRIINIKVRYIMFMEDDPYTDLCVKNIINQLFTLITTSFSFSTFWNVLEQSQLKTMQYLACNNASRYQIHFLRHLN